MSTIIEAKNLYLGYKKNEQIIKNANFTINTRDFIFISGVSGSGKSTLLRAIYGDLDMMHGRLSVCGLDVTTASVSRVLKLRKKLGIVFQDYKLIEEWNVEKNIMLPMIINGYNNNVCVTKVEKLLHHVKLQHKAGKYPLELSGGEQQRVAMARAVAARPLIILADEPTGNLDDYSSDMIWDLLSGANTELDITIIVVTHRIPHNLSIEYRHFDIDQGAINEIY